MLSFHSLSSSVLVRFFLGSERLPEVNNFQEEQTVLAPSVRGRPEVRLKVKGLKAKSV